MNFEQKMPESEEVRGIYEGMRDVQIFKDKGSITRAQFNEQASNIKAHILELIQRGDPVALELAKRFKANFPYHAKGL